VSPAKAHPRLLCGPRVSPEEAASADETSEDELKVVGKIAELEKKEAEEVEGL